MKLRFAITTSIFLFVAFGCLGTINPFQYPEPYVDNRTLHDCIEGKTINTYLTNNKTQSIKVEVYRNSAQFCYVKYNYEGWNYVSGYDKDLGKLCRYEATAPGSRKSNSVACSKFSFGDLI